ncbi:putative ATP-dependent DNA helicase HFM1 [Brevipalpus obovatus]|uniref:putative ATP-dependent DNA helicase HFM1 n=1 Tax=Brevipalpus obovatus TaxID=246614 RepID=UPI003D9E9E4F
MRRELTGMSARCTLNQQSRNAISVRTKVYYSEEEKKNLIPTTVIPAKYRPVFEKFSHFNIMQSRVFDRVFKHDETLVVSAPTGSGKTVIFELAIVNELIKQEMKKASSSSSLASSSIDVVDNSFKVVYIAPLKSLCSQRFEDWQIKFSPFNLMCAELTGDTNNDEIIDLRRISIIMTTPEKWDILTRSKDFQNSMESIRLILIDEVHLLNDEGRGPKLEALVSRFKMAYKTRGHSNSFRFIAVSATAPNSSDIAEWLSEHERVQYDLSSRSIVLSDDYRSVQLMKKVIGYHCASSWNDFLFEASLNSKLRAVIEQYSEQKPTLVFVATRKSCYQTAKKLAEDGTFVGRNYHLSVLRALQNTLKDSKLKENILKGIAFHNAGLTVPDRQAIEKYFHEGHIPVLISTSTLALGVNLPAHLVVIKGTFHYVNGECIEYSESEISQMMGRAGRPDYGAKGRAVIMTKKQLETKYKKLISGTQPIESYLPKYLCECLNAEIVLRTICSISEAIDWMNSTFFAIRVRKNPENYNMDPLWTNERIQEKLQDMIKIELNRLKRLDLIQVCDTGNYFKSTSLGVLMAIRSLNCSTMEKLVQLKGNETLQQLLSLICKCEEVASSSRLRSTEKRCLNALNIHDKNEPVGRSIRFPFNGKIAHDHAKAYVLIQSIFGDLEIETSLIQDAHRAIKVGERVARCLSEVVFQRSESFRLVLNSMTLHKCFRAQMWENSSYIARQLPKIGTKLAESLVRANLSSFEDIENTDPRKLELFMGRRAPFGKQIKEAALRIPKYEISIQTERKDKYGGPLGVIVEIRMKNYQLVERTKVHNVLLIVGTPTDKILFKSLISERTFFIKDGYHIVQVNIPNYTSAYLHLISDYYVGIDISYEIFPEFGAAVSDIHKSISIRPIDGYYDAFVAPLPSKEEDDPGDIELLDEAPDRVLDSDDDPWDIPDEELEDVFVWQESS